MSKFKAGDVVYCLQSGIKKIERISDDPQDRYPIKINESEDRAYMLDGRYTVVGKDPMLLTLEEALEKSYITQAEYDEHKPKTKKWQVFYEEDGRYGFSISIGRYSSKEEFLQKNYPGFKFAGFYLPSEVEE